MKWWWCIFSSLCWRRGVCYFFVNYVTGQLSCCLSEQVKAECVYLLVCVCVSWWRICSERGWTWWRPSVRPVRPGTRLSASPKIKERKWNRFHPWTLQVSSDRVGLQLLTIIAPSLSLPLSLSFLLILSVSPWCSFLFLSISLPHPVGFSFAFLSTEYMLFQQTLSIGLVLCYIILRNAFDLLWFG